MYYLNVYDNVRIVYHQQLVEAINSYPWRSISRRTMKRVIADIKQRSPHGSEKQLEHLRFINRMIDIRSRA